MKGFQKGHKICLGKKYALGYRHTDDAKKRIGLASKMRKRKPFTVEHKQRMSLAHLGHKLTKEHKRKIGLASKGFKHTESSKAKMRIATLLAIANGRKMPDNSGRNWSLKSRKKLSEFLTGKMGDKSRNWKGGITTKNQIIRSSEKMTQWKKFVFERDNYTCQKCGQRGGKIQADHELPFSLYPALHFEILNGQTLCKICHKIKTKKDREIYKNYPLNTCF